MKQKIPYMRHLSRVLLAIALFLPSTNHILAKETILLQNADQETLAAFPILDRTVMKFRNGSIILTKNSTTHSTPLASIDSIQHIGEYRSDFEVSVVLRKSNMAPMEGVLVTLHNENYSEWFGVIKKTDSEGKVMFPNIPTGLYTIYLVDEENRFPSFTESGILHSYFDSKTFILKEKFPTIHVDSVLDNFLDSKPYYDLNGLIVRDLTPGIYIHNGKKVIVR